jgi:Tfp pilus assembly protein PilO
MSDQNPITPVSNATQVDQTVASIDSSSVVEAKEKPSVQSLAKTKSKVSSLFSKRKVVDEAKNNTDQTKERPTAESIEKQTSNIIKIGLISSTLIILTSGVLSFLANSKTKQLTQIKQQIATKQQDDVNLQKTVEFIETNEAVIEPIIEALPDENSLVDFISVIEAIADSSSSNSSLEFSALAPATSGQDKYLPFVIELETDTVNFEEFLKKVEKLAYVVEVYSIEASLKDKQSDLWNFSVSARIFVRDPFKS